MRKRLARWGRLLCSLCLALVLLSGSALAERPVVRVGYVDDSYLMTQNADGTYKGVLYNFLEMVAAYAGVEMVYVQGGISENYTRLANGEIDMLPGVMAGRTPHKGKPFILSKHSMSETTLQVAMRDHKAIDNGQKLRIGYYAPSVNLAPLRPWLEHQMEDYGPGYELVPFTVPGQPDKEYMAGNIDGVITDTMHPEPVVSDTYSLLNEKTYIAFRPEDTELARKIDTAMEDVLLSVPDFSRTLQRQLEVSFTPAERQYLSGLDKLRVAISPGQRPYTWFENGEARGVIADILELLSDDLGVSMEVEEYDSNKEMFQAFANGEVDIIADFNSDPNWAEQHQAVITAPYLQLNYVAVTRRNDPLPEHPMVACVRGHHYTQEFVEPRCPEEQRVYFNTVKACLQAVSKGAADITYEKALTAQYDIAHGDFYNLTTTGNVEFTHGVSVALHDNVDPRLLRILNKAVTHLSEDKVEGIINKHLINQPHPRSLGETILRNPVAAIQSVLVGFVVLALVLGGYLLLRYRYIRKLRRLAYINEPTGMHTLNWFQPFALEEIEKREKARRQGRLWLAIMGAQRFMFMKESYDFELLVAGIRKLIERAHKLFPYFCMEAANAENTSVYALCELPPDVTPESLVQDMQAQISHIDIGAVRTSINFRTGFCQIPRHSIKEADLTKLLEWTMLAQDEANKRDQPCIVYDNTLRDEVMQQQQIEHYMHKALQNHEFQVWLQPKYDIRTHRTVGAEALVRWHSPELGLLPPGRFVKLFETNGFVVDLDYYMLEQVLRIQQLRCDQGKRFVPISVNQSGLHISEEGYLDRMREILAKFDLPRGAVDLEITETAFVDYTTQGSRTNATDIVRELQQMGYLISMDDFCTGYSSIAMLRNLPMDIMKIDRSMLLAAEEDPRAEKILRYVINMGDALGMQVLCEGIETLSQEQLLLDNGCFYGQGYLFGKPMQLDDFLAKLDAEDAAAARQQPQLAH